MNPVLKYLQTHDGYSFDEGVAVLLAFSANRGVNSFILARRDKYHLHNELCRLAHIPHLELLPNATMPACMMEPETPKEEAPEPPQDPEPPAKDQGKAEDDEDDEDDFVSFLDLKRHETYKPEDLPTPMLKELWQKNRDEYKELQHCHQMMKEANSDAGRADWRKKVLALQESIKERWELFDSEMEKAKSAKPATEDDGYNPFNDRSYISKALKKPSWSDEYKVKIQHMVDALLGHNIPIKEETLERLRERGITV